MTDPNRPDPNRSYTEMSLLIHHTSTGTGPPVVLVHGTGLGSQAFDGVVTELARCCRVLVPDRRGYGGSATLGASACLEDHVNDLVALLDTSDIEAAVFAGVSGGATIVLAFALEHPQRVASALVHEPALGNLAPALATILGAANERLHASRDSARRDSADAATDFVAQLVGPSTWGQLPDFWKRLVAVHADIIAVEVPQFLAFSPSVEDLSALRSLRLVASHGSRSNQARRDVTTALAEHAGASVVQIEGAAHVAHVDTPEAFAAVLRDLVLEQAVA